MKYFINLFWLCGCLGGQCAFSWGIGESEPSLLPSALGLQMILGVCESNFQMLAAWPSLRGEGSAVACSAEEPKGIPAEKYGFLDLTQRALPNLKWTNCWLFKKQMCCWAKGRQWTLSPSRGNMYSLAPCSRSSSKVCVRNTCKLPTAAQGYAAAGCRWFPWLSGTQHVAAEIL